MVERRKELTRRYHRKQKIRRLKVRLAKAKDTKERDNLLRKIRLLSPWWQDTAAASA